MLRITAGKGDRNARPPLVASKGDEPARAKGERILVVEDDWLVSLEIESALDDAGFEIVGIATTAAQALSMAELHQPQLILMDIRLQGNADGVDAAIEIHRRLGIRAIFVSANLDPKMKERAQAADPMGWIPKPFSSPQLVSGVRAALAGSRGE
jgi:two-component system, response regulator PdtaR